MQGPCGFIRCVKEKVKDTVRLDIEFSTFDGRVLLGLDGLGLRPLVQRHLAMGTRGGVWQIRCFEAPVVDSRGLGQPRVAGVRPGFAQGLELGLLVERVQGHARALPLSAIAFVGLLPAGLVQLGSLAEAMGERRGGWISAALIRAGQPRTRDSPGAFRWPDLTSEKVPLEDFIRPDSRRQGARRVLIAVHACSLPGLGVSPWDRQMSDICYACLPLRLLLEEQTLIRFPLPHAQRSDPTCIDGRDAFVVR